MNIDKYLITEAPKIQGWQKKVPNEVKKLAKDARWKFYNTDKNNPLWDNNLGNPSKNNVHMASAENKGTSIVVYWDESMGRVFQQIISKKIALKKVTSQLLKGDIKLFFNREV